MQLAGAHDESGEHETALALFLRVLELDTAELGEASLNVASTLNNLGMVYESLGDYGRAIEMHEKSLQAYSILYTYIQPYNHTYSLTHSLTH